MAIKAISPFPFHFPFPFLLPPSHETLTFSPFFSDPINRNRWNNCFQSGMDPIETRQRSTSSSMIAIILTIFGVVSTLYINQTPLDELEEDEEPLNLTSWLPLLLLVLILAISLSLYLDQSFNGFDPNWIYRVGGSSGGIALTLLVLAFVLRFKSGGFSGGIVLILVTLALVFKHKTSFTEN